VVFETGLHFPKFAIYERLPIDDAQNVSGRRVESRRHHRRWGRAPFCIETGARIRFRDQVDARLWVGPFLRLGLQSRLRLDFRGRTRPAVIVIGHFISIVNVMVLILYKLSLIYASNAWSQSIKWYIRCFIWACLTPKYKTRLLLYWTPLDYQEVTIKLLLLQSQSSKATKHYNIRQHLAVAVAVLCLGSDLNTKLFLASRWKGVSWRRRFWNSKDSEASAAGPATS